MEKALEILQTYMAQELEYGVSSYSMEYYKKAIAEAKQFIDEAERIRMLCDDMGKRISELKVQEAKSCKDCKFLDAGDKACTILTNAVLESNGMPKTFYCSLFEKATK